MSSLFEFSEKWAKREEHGCKVLTFNWDATWRSKQPAQIQIHTYVVRKSGVQFNVPRAISLPCMQE